MSLELVYLKIRVNTIDGPYGIDIPFSKGLFLLRMDNSQGKSTCMNSIAYALGMEKALGLGNAKIPFPPSLTRALTNKYGKEIKVISSYVELIIKNKETRVAVLKRTIVGVENINIIQINEDKKTEPYFLHREGDTDREHGFYNWFANFLNWDIPKVPNHQGKDSPLYPAVLFPAWFVEQKKGWSSILATIPTQFGIKDPKKRVIEFLLSLDVNDNLLKRSTIKNKIEEIKIQWKIIKNNLENIAYKVSATATGIPEQPENKFDSYKIDLIVQNEEKISSLIDIKTELQSQLLDIDKNSNTKFENKKVDLDVVRIISTKLGEINLLENKLQELINYKSYINYQISSTNNRIKNLVDDKRKYEDIKKISSSEMFNDLNININECPTCGAHYNDNLLDLHSKEDNLMTYESSLVFIKEQIKAFEFVLDDSKDKLKLKNNEQKEIESKIAQLKSDVNRIKNNDNNNLVIKEEVLRKKIKIENLIENIDDAYNYLMEIKLKLDALNNQFIKLTKKRKSFPLGNLSAEDDLKLRSLNDELIKRLNKYNFTSFDANLISISEDTYFPTREGYDIGFDTSASDGIRIIWGYLLSLFSIGNQYTINHPNLVIFDEPRQQEANKVSFSELLKDAAESSINGGQIIFATSEEESILNQALKGYKYNIISFDKNDGKLIRKIDG